MGMRRFDAVALYRALNQQREAKDLSWAETARIIGVSPATIARLKDGGRLEVDGMLAMVGWLGVTVETFVREVSS
jgi:transcriptional regulator with XRE-family HTH domain